MMRVRTHKQSDICALWAPAISGGLDRARLLPMMRYWLVEKCQCWITAGSLWGNRKECRDSPAGHWGRLWAFRWTLRRSGSWTAERMAHITEGPRQAALRGIYAFHSARSPRGLGWCDHRLVWDFFQVCSERSFKNRTDMWEQTCNGHTSCLRKGNGENETELLFSSTFVSKQPTRTQVPALSVCVWCRRGEKREF